ncbi:MAG: triose-phosphate isomerase [Planctomycetes bacterium]|nr:triose-phosphate isomerase [Planctomycetota bacterium]
MRKPIIAGNWKMNKTVSEAVDFVEAIKRDLADIKGVDVVVCPPFTALQAVGNVIAGTAIGLGAQNMHWEKSGAFTGAVSAGMLRELYCHYVIIGHSERRSLFGETDSDVNRKVKTALASNLLPIVCVGETLKQRKAGKTESVLKTQIEKGLKNIEKKELKSLITAYEPIWAIGTGVTATPDQAQQGHQFIRGLLKGMSDEKTSQSIRIQYGGSVKPENAGELFQQPDIDGGLIGGASLDADSFVRIVKSVLCAG